MPWKNSVHEFGNSNLSSKSRVSPIKDGLIKQIGDGSSHDNKK